MPSTQIYIGIDYPITEEQREGHYKIVKYVTKISGFRNVIILSQDNNLGPSRNSAQLIRRLKEDGYNRYILQKREMDMACNAVKFDEYYYDRRRMRALYSKSKNQFCNFVKGYTGYTNDMLGNNEVLPVDLSYGLNMFFAGKRMVFPVNSKVRNWVTMEVEYTVQKLI